VTIGDGMFLPKEMTEVQLVVPEQDLPAVTDDLAGRGILQPVDAAATGLKNLLGESKSRRDEAAGYAALERRIVSLLQTLRIREGPPPPADRLTAVDAAAAGTLVERIAGEAGDIGAQLDQERKRLDQLGGNLRQLAPVADIPFDLAEVKKSRYVVSILGVIPTVNLARLETSLERVPHILAPLRSDRRDSVVWLSGVRSDAETLLRAARSAYLNPLNLPDARGTPAEISAALRTAAARSEERRRGLEAALDSLRRKREAELRQLLWRTRVSRNRAEAAAKFGSLRYSAVIAGWIPTEQWRLLAAGREPVFGRILSDAAPRDRGAGSENTPVLIEHRGLLRSFQQLAAVFARPLYNELDPTVLLAVTFPLLYGIMFGDVGHGLELALVGALLASGRVRALRGFAGLGPLIAICGLSGCLFGFLYGSVFGSDSVLPPLWIRPIDSVLEIMTFSIGAGVTILSVGMILNIINAAIARDWGKVWFGHNGLAGLALYWALAAIAAEAFGVRIPLPAAALILPAAAGGIGVMFSEALERLVRGERPLWEDSPGSFAAQSFFGLFETALGLFSNSMSFIRLGAFAVAHAGLSLVFFLLAAQVSPGRGIGYWVVVLAGNLLIVGFEGLIVGIQSMRLEYYEFFNKFFRGGGPRFDPLTRLPNPR
jgi:V/A-type H+-transporting ATPase subunit I